MRLGAWVDPTVLEQLDRVLDVTHPSEVRFYRSDEVRFEDHPYTPKRAYADHRLPRDMRLLYSTKGKPL